MTAPTAPWLPRTGGPDGAPRRHRVPATAGRRIGWSARLPGCRPPRILPLNFVLVRDALFLRTTPAGEVARWALGDEVCFEVDHVDDFLRVGWSVLVTGRLREPSSDLIRSLDVDDLPPPWPGGVRSLLMEIPLTRVTGRRVHPS